MKISLSTIPNEYSKKNTGYSYAFSSIYDSIGRSNSVAIEDDSALVHISFSMPPQYNYSNCYNVGYTPWESTGLPDGWADSMNKCHEIWTPSPLIKEWYQMAGVRRPIYVYQHGITDLWKTRKRRRPKSNVRFLHLGEPAPRKGGQMALNAFLAAFGNRTDVSLTFKAFKQSSVRIYNGESIIGTPDEWPGMSLIRDDLPFGQLPAFFKQYDVLVYPSYGEGFGFIPLQAMATGMPVISSDTWPPYAHLMNKKLLVKTKFVTSPWQTMHPGNVLEPDFDHLVETYRYAADNITEISARAYQMAPAVWQEYDWDRITNKVMREFQNRLYENILVHT